MSGPEKIGFKTKGHFSSPLPSEREDSFDQETDGFGRLIAQPILQALIFRAGLLIRGRWPVVMGMVISHILQIAHWDLEPLPRATVGRGVPPRRLLESALGFCGAGGGQPALPCGSWVTDT